MCIRDRYRSDVLRAVQKLRAHIRSPADIGVGAGQRHIQLIPLTVEHLVHPHLKPPRVGIDFPHHTPAQVFRGIFPEKSLPAAGIAQRKAIRHMLPALKHIEDLEARPIRIDLCHMHGIPVPQLDAQTIRPYITCLLYTSRCV